MEQMKRESQLERYWRLRGEADELYQKRMREMHQKMSVELRGFVQKELDALEEAIEQADLSDVLRHKLILEVLMV
jgi:hypothetical protein